MERTIMDSMSTGEYRERKRKQTHGNVYTMEIITPQQAYFRSATATPSISADQGAIHRGANGRPQQLNLSTGQITDADELEDFIATLRDAWRWIGGKP